MATTQEIAIQRRGHCLLAGKVGQVGAAQGRRPGGPVFVGWQQQTVWKVWKGTDVEAREIVEVGNALLERRHGLGLAYFKRRSR